MCGEQPFEHRSRSAIDGQSVIQFEQVTKAFGPVVAVHETDLAIDEGSFFSLLGPSGCGKTTTLRMIAGFERPTRGRILLDGTDVSAVPPYRRNVNTVFQQYALFPHLTVFDNVAFGLRSKRVGRDEIRRRVGEMLDVVRLVGLGERKPNQLSGGQQQRVALARALVNRPRALLLDEPLGALDLKLRETMQVELKRIQRELGSTFVYVTHDQGEALTMSDRIAVMDQGRTEQIGTPQEIYHRPATAFVAAFIGTANLLPGRAVTVDADGAAIDVDGVGRLAVSGPVPAGCAPGSPVLFMVRPEAIVVSPADAGGDDGRAPTGRTAEVTVTVTELLFAGAVVRCTGHSEQGTTLVADIGPTAATVLPRVGDRVRMAWAPEAASVVPADPGDHADEYPDPSVAPQIGAVR